MNNKDKMNIEQFMKEWFEKAGYVTSPWRGYIYDSEGIKLAITGLVEWEKMKEKIPQAPL